MHVPEFGNGDTFCHHGVSLNGSVTLERKTTGNKNNDKQNCHYFTHSKQVFQLKRADTTVA